MFAPPPLPKNRTLSIGPDLTDVEASLTQVSPHEYPVPHVRLSFPPGDFTILDPPTKIGEGFLLIATNMKKSHLDAFLSANSDVVGKFWWSDEKLRFEYSKKTAIETSTIVAMDIALYQYNKRMCILTGRDRLFTQHGRSGVESMTALMSPDFSWSNVERLHLDCIIVGEVSYSQDLRIVHLKVADYFRHFPDIIAVIVIDVMYPWTIINNSYDPQNGRMTAFYYNRTLPYNEQTPDGVLSLFAPVCGISFGNSMLSAANINRAMLATNINQNNLTGFTNTNPLPCNGPNMNEFSLLISGSVILVADPGNSNSILGTALNALPAQYDFLIDLYRVKLLVVTQALPIMNARLKAVAAAMTGGGVLVPNTPTAAPLLEAKVPAEPQSPSAMALFETDEVEAGIFAAHHGGEHDQLKDAVALGANVLELLNPQLPAAPDPVAVQHLHSEPQVPAHPASIAQDQPGPIAPPDTPAAEKTTRSELFLKPSRSVDYDCTYPNKRS